MGGGDSLGILINYGIFGIPKDPRPKKFTDVRFRRPGFFFCRPASWTFCLCRLASWISSSVGRLFGYFSFIGQLLGYLVRWGVKFRNEASFFFVFFKKRFLTFLYSFCRYLPVSLVLDAYRVSFEALFFFLLY